MASKPKNKKSTSLEKLLIDNPSDFQFHAAYLTYSDTYDKTTSLEIKEQLNRNIMSLQQNKIDYSTFYKNINQYRMDANPQYPHHRTRIEVQRKREWRRKTKKRQRNQRHKK
jgi:hypothetical protein